MKAKKNLAYRLAQTIPDKSIGNFLDFVKWYKSEIHDFVALVLDHRITKDSEWEGIRDYKSSSLRVYKSKMKECVLEFKSLNFRNKRQMDLRNLLRLRVLNEMGESFSNDSNVMAKSLIGTVSSNTQPILEVLFCIELIKSSREFTNDYIQDVVFATERGKQASQNLSKLFDVHSFYWQTEALSQSNTILRSEHQVNALSLLTNHSARFIKYEDLKQTSLKYYWLLGNCGIEYYNDDHELYLQYVRKTAELVMNNLRIFSNSEEISLFMRNLNLFNAAYLNKGTEMMKNYLGEMSEVLKSMKFDNSHIYYATYYASLIQLSILDKSIVPPVQELEELLTSSDQVSENSNRRFKFILVQAYMFSKNYFDANRIANQIINEQGKAKLSQSIVEVTGFLIILIQFSTIFLSIKQGSMNQNDVVYLHSLISSYKEKIRKKKHEYLLELIFIDVFNSIEILSNIKNITKKIEFLRKKVKQSEVEKSIQYQIQFKRLFDYDLWFENILEN